jgi:hypothetical protein
MSKPSSPILTLGLINNIIPKRVRFQDTFELGEMIEIEKNSPDDKISKIFEEDSQSEDTILIENPKGSKVIKGEKRKRISREYRDLINSATQELSRDPSTTKPATRRSSRLEIKMEKLESTKTEEVPPEKAKRKSTSKSTQPKKKVRSNTPVVDPVKAVPINPSPILNELMTLYNLNELPSFFDKLMKEELELLKDRSRTLKEYLDRNGWGYMEDRFIQMMGKDVYVDFLKRIGKDRVWRLITN